jgi:hypothetical protein
MNGTRVSRWADWLIALCVAVASAAIVIWQNSHLAVLWDLSYILENSYRMSLGQIPYRDFPFPYAPLTFLTQAALIKLMGRVFFHHVIYCAVVNGLSVLLTWRILLRILYATSNKRLVALLLTTPLAVLSVYGIFPHPFYDCDCTFVVLVCLFLLSRFQHRAAHGKRENGDAAIRVGSLLESFFAGVLLIIPFFTKQNTGGVFLISAIACLVLLFLIDIYNRRNISKYILLFAGLIISLCVAILLIHHFAGLHNYYRWTFRFAAQRRMPAFADMIGMYKDTGTVWWLLPVVVGLVLNRLNRRNRLIGGLSVVFILVPFVWPVIYLVLDRDASERAERLLNLWPTVLILSVVAIVAVIRRRSVADLIVPSIVIATVHGAFLSQQLWGSTYALWPMFVILIAFVISALCWEGGSTVSESSSDISQALPNGQVSVSVLASVISFCLLIAGAFYMRSHERLDYANLDDGDLAHSTNPALKGMATRGSWLTDFDELVAYANKEIPREDGILCLPGEDLFYYTTGRRPQFPVVMFDHTVNPYSPQEIVDIARERNINWLIVKNDLQLEEEPIERKDELMNLLMQQFESVDSLNNYEIYKRMSPDEEDDRDDDEKAPATAPIKFYR